jgi:hypothetical protein
MKMNMRRTFVLVVAVAFTVGTQAWAATKVKPFWGFAADSAKPIHVPAIQHEKIEPMEMPNSDSPRNLASDQLRKKPGNENDLSEGMYGMRDKMVNGQMEYGFRTRLLNVRDPEKLARILDWYNSNYNRLRPDVRYVVARLMPLRAFRGFFWRMAPLTHKSLVSQMTLLGMVRGFAENLMLYEGSTHWKAYLAYLTIPSIEQATPAPNGRDARFKNENDITRFLLAEVAPTLTSSVDRMKDLVSYFDGKEPYKRPHSVFYWDQRLRWGSGSFNDNFNDDGVAIDRFAAIGRGEALGTMARFSRRLAVIYQLAAFNWNGYAALRNKLGEDVGIGLGAQFLPWVNDPYAVEGLTREGRVDAVKKFVDTQPRTPEGHKLFDCIDPEALDVAYGYFKNFADYTNQAWDTIRGEWNSPQRSTDFLLDPDLVGGREDQIDRGVKQMYRMVYYGKDTPVGSVTGEKVTIDLKSFLSSSHWRNRNLTELLPRWFQEEHTDLLTDDLKKHYESNHLAVVEKKDRVWVVKDSARDKLLADLDKATNHELPPEDGFEWRDYTFQRATRWRVDAYDTLFPEVTQPTQVAEKQRALSEVRGGRALMNTLALFIK